MSLNCCSKWLAFLGTFPHFFLAIHPSTPMPPGQLASRVMRFTHHIQAIKFSLVYGVVARIGVLAAQRLRTFEL